MSVEKGILGIEDMRGSFQIIETKTFLVNDNEEFRWRLVVCKKLLKLKLIFIPMEIIQKNPPISIYADSSDNETVIEFKGWNSSATFSIQTPIELVRIGQERIAFSVFNQHYGISNICTMQIYRDIKHLNDMTVY